MPMVLMKVLAMKRRGFMFLRWCAIVHGRFAQCESLMCGWIASIDLRACRRGGRRIHLKNLSGIDRRFADGYCNRDPAAEVVTGAPASTAGNLTPAAIVKVKEIMATQDPVPAGLRIGVVGGGCSGFQYSMSFENQSGMMDKVYKFEDLKVFVDATSAMYLKNCTVDYVETLEAAGFKFENAAVKSTCGCGSSFSV